MVGAREDPAGVRDIPPRRERRGSCKPCGGRPNPLTAKRYQGRAAGRRPHSRRFNLLRRAEDSDGRCLARAVGDGTAKVRVAHPLDDPVESGATERRDGTSAAASGGWALPLRTHCERTHSECVIWGRRTQSGHLVLDFVLALNGRPRWAKRRRCLGIKHRAYEARGPPDSAGPGLHVEPPFHRGFSPACTISGRMTQSHAAPYRRS